MTPDSSSPANRNELPAEVVVALQRGNKIEAIKLLREAQQIGLKEAKEQVETYRRGGPAPANTNEAELPGEVIVALQRGNKIAAIKRLREVRQLGLKVAKQQVEAYLVDHPEISPKASKKNCLLTVALVLTFVWAFVTSVDAVSNLIVLANLDGYQSETFTIGKLRYDQDGEGGLLWGFEGRIGGIDVRLYAPQLADAKELGYRRLQKLFPLGTKMPVWYNPEVTDTLFQGRTLRLIPYSPDLQESELKRFMGWFTSCLLPFLLLLFLARRLDLKKRARHEPDFHDTRL